MSAIFLLALTVTINTGFTGTSHQNDDGIVPMHDLDIETNFYI